MRAFIFLIALPIVLFATSSVDIRVGPAYDGLVEPRLDCGLSDKATKAIRIETAVFDDDGREIRRAMLQSCSRTSSTEEHWTFTLDSNGSVLRREKSITIFDGQHRVLEFSMHNWDEGAESVQRYHNSYDAEGRLLTSRVTDGDEDSVTWQTTYDDSGDPVTVTRIDSGGESKSVTQARFDGQHRLISESTDSGPVDHRMKYDSQGRLLEEVRGHGEARNIVRYTYDEQGRQLSRLSVVGSSGRDQVRDGFSYWPNGLIKEEWTLDSQGIASRFESYAYDDHNHVTQQWIYTPGGSDESKKFFVTVDGRLQNFGNSNGLPLITYTYDSHGNWVKAVETALSDSNNPASERETSAIYYRQIEYR